MEIATKALCALAEKECSLTSLNNKLRLLTYNVNRLLDDLGSAVKVETEIPKSPGTKRKVKYISITESGLEHLRKKLVQRLKTLEAVYKEPTILKSGEISDFYIDIKKAYGDSESRHMMAALVWNQLRDARPTCLVVSGHGGFIGGFVADRHDLDLTIVRDETKKHGKKGWPNIDGHIPNTGDRIAYVDDVKSTGGSFEDMKLKVEELGIVYENLGYYCVVRRGAPMPNLHWVLTAEDLL